MEVNEQMEYNSFQQFEPAPRRGEVQVSPLLSFDTSFFDLLAFPAPQLHGARCSTPVFLVFGGCSVVVPPVAVLPVLERNFSSFMILRCIRERATCAVCCVLCRTSGFQTSLCMHSIGTRAPGVRCGRFGQPLRPQGVVLPAAFHALVRHLSRVEHLREAGCVL